MAHLLIPGAGGSAWYWHRVVPLLEQAGLAVIAVDLPADDPEAEEAAMEADDEGLVNAEPDNVEATEG